MDDEVLARLAALVGVVLAGEHERLHDLLAVDLLGDLVGVLLDDREQVGEQLPLGRGQLGGRLAAAFALGRGTVDRVVRAHRHLVAARGERLAQVLGDLLTLVGHRVLPPASVAQAGAADRPCNPLSGL